MDDVLHWKLGTSARATNAAVHQLERNFEQPERAGMPEAVWVVGGEQRGVSNWTKEWNLYKKALVVKVGGDTYSNTRRARPPSTLTTKAFL